MQKKFFGQKISGFLSTFLLAVTLAILSGCGGAPGSTSGSTSTSGVGSSTITQTLTATVATGAMLNGALIEVKDSSSPYKTTHGTTDSSGHVTLDVTGMTAPLMLQATSSTLAQPMYSIVPVLSVSTTTSTTATVDITPVTTLVMYALNNGTDPSYMFLEGGFTSLTSQSNIETTASKVQASLSALGSHVAGVDMMGYDNTVPLVVGNAYDTALDNLGSITQYQNGTATLLTTGSVQTLYVASATTGNLVSSVTVTTGGSVTADGASSTFVRATVTGTSGPVQGATVTFAATAGTLSSNTATTDSSGFAQVLLKAPTIAGSVSVAAATGGASGSASVTFTAGAPSVIGLNAAPLTVVPSGTTVFTAAVLDSNGNPVAGQTVSLTTNSTTGGQFTPNSATTDANGRVSATYAAGNCANCIEVLTATTNNGISKALNLAVSSGAAVIGSLTTNSNISSITANGSSSATISATVKSGISVVPGVIVSFATTGGALNKTSAVTDSNGVATVTLTSGVTAMTASVTASAGGFSSNTSVIFTAGGAAVVGVNAAPNAVNPKGASTITAAVLDNNGNPVPNTAVVFSFTATNSASGVGAQPTLGQVNTTPQKATITASTDSNGLARAAYLAGPANGTDTIQAAVSGVAPTTTNITVSAANTSVVGSVAVTAGSNSIPVTTGSTVIVATVKDTSGNPVNDVTVTFAVSSGSLSSASATTTNGVATTTLTAGSTVLTATITASASGFSSNTSVNYTAGAANTVTVSATPGTVNTSGTATISALVTDANNNPVVGESVHFAFTATGSGQPTLSGGINNTVVTNANGLATITYTAGTGNGADTITATSSNAQSGNTTVTVNNSAIVVGGISLTTGAATLPTGNNCAAVTATVTDNTGAPAPGITVNFTTSAGTLSAASATTVTNGTNATAQVSLCSGNNLGTATVTADASGFAQTTTVTFIASNPNSIGLLATPVSVNSGGTSILTAIVRDTQLNPVVGQTVTFAIGTNNSGAQLNGATVTTAVTNASGIATVTYTAGTTASVSDSISATLTNGKTTGVSIAVTPSSTPTAAILTLSASPTTVKSDDSNSTTVTVTALSASNAALQNVIVSLGSAITTDLSGASGVAGGGVLGAQTVTTGANGQATFTFHSGTVSKDDRTVTITATATAASGVSALLPVQIVGSTVTVNSSGSSATTAGTNPAVTQTLTFTAKDAGNNLIANTPITVSQSSLSGGAMVTFSPGVTATNSGAVSLSGVTGDGVTSPLGQYTVTVFGGALTGSVSVAATALGTTAASTITVTGTPFGINEVVDTTATPSSSVVANPTVATMKNTDSMIVLVNAPDPATANVLFASTLGVWNGGTTTATTSTAGGVSCTAHGTTVTTTARQACAILTTPNTAGLANVQVTDPLNSSYSASLAVSVTATTPTTLTLQASPAVVPKGSGGVSTLIATVKDANGLPVGGQPVTFSIPYPTGGGESISPVVAYTATTATSTLGLGQALTTFTAGSQTSGANGIQIDAIVPGTAASGVAAVVIGGTAGSVAFGQATSVTTSTDGTNYILNMSALVADSSGNPVPAGTVLNISAWPIAWDTGVPCKPDKTGPYYNEDINENLILDAGEDGLRISYPSGTPLPTGTLIGSLVPPAAAAGVVQSTKAGDLLLGASIVTTDASGIASFTLTYPKNSALFIWDRIRATTAVQGTEAVGEVIFELPASVSDAGGSTCLLPASPYSY